MGTARDVAITLFCKEEMKTIYQNCISRSLLKRSSNFCLVLFIVLVSNVSFAQESMIGRKILQRPMEYDNGPYRVLGKNAATNFKAIGNIWIVYSDRDDNASYTAPDVKSAVISKLSFRQALFVLDETDDFVQVAQYDKLGYNKSTRIISQELKYHGWVPKENVLLWQKGMVDPITKFTKKSIAVNTITTLNDVDKYAKDENLLLYTSPNGKVRSDAQIKLYNFVFIYKETADSYLIGKKTGFAVMSVEDDILGWVSKDIVQTWNQRLALQPSGGAGAQERKLSNVPIKLFTTTADATAYYFNPALVNNTSELLFKDDFKEWQMAERPRLPVLSVEGTNPQIIHTGLTTPIYNEEKEVIIDVDEQITLNREYEIIRDKKSNVNIIFLVDGSQSMQQYTKPICTAIRDATLTISDLASESSNIEYGAIVYRGLNEDKCGNMVIQPQPLTANEQEVINFLSEDVLRIDCAESGDNKALYRGMKAAMDMFSKSKQLNETNVLILIGGEGNDPLDATTNQNELIDRITELNCSLMCFQVKYNEKPAFNKFQKDLRDIIRTSEQNIQSKHKDLYNTFIPVEYADDARDQDLLRMPYPEAAPVPGYFVWSPPMQPMKSTRLKDEIQKIILESIENNERLFAHGDAQIRGVGKRFVMDEATKNFLSQMNVDVDLLKRAAQTNIQFFMEGVTTVRNSKLTNDMFEYVIFVEDEEFATLNQELGRLVNEGLTINEQKEALETSFRKLASSYLGPGETKDIVKSMTMEDVLKKLQGLPGSKGIPLLKRRIDDLSTMTNNEIDELVTYFGAHFHMMEEYRNNAENAFFNSGQRFFWIPQRILP